jgi:MFS family permease
MSIKRNIPLIYITDSLMWGRFFIPVLALFYIASQVSIAQFSLIMSIFAIATLIFEIPSGVITDLIGKKRALIISRSLYIIEIFLIAFFNGFWIFLIAKIISGIGVSLSSGTDSALIYDTLKKMKREKDYKRIAGIKSTIVSISMAVIFIIGGFLFSVNNKLPAIASLPLITLGLILTFFIEEPYINQRKANLDNCFKQLKESLTFFKKSNYLKYLAFFSLPIATLISILFSMSSAYFQAVYIPIFIIGILSFLSSMTIAFSSRISHSMEKRFGEKKSLFLMWFLILISVGGMALMLKQVGAIFFFLIPFVDGFFGVVIDTYANKYIRTSHRTTILSIKNMFNNIGVFILFPIVGYITKLISLQFALIFLGAFFLVYSIFLLIYLKVLKLQLE